MCTLHVQDLDKIEQALGDVAPTFPKVENLTRPRKVVMKVV